MILALIQRLNFSLLLRAISDNPALMLFYPVIVNAHQQDLFAAFRLLRIIFIPDLSDSLFTGAAHL